MLRAGDPVYTSQCLPFLLLTKSSILATCHSEKSIVTILGRITDLLISYIEKLPAWEITVNHLKPFEENLFVDLL